MSLKRLFQDNAAPAGKLVAEISASRYAIETNGGLHRIYDTEPTEGESHPLADMQHPLNEQETKDRAAVNDAALSMPARLAALNRLNIKKR